MSAMAATASAHPEPPLVTFYEGKREEREKRNA
jgi:hypothetical protein